MDLKPEFVIESIGINYKPQGIEKRVEIQVLGKQGFVVVSLRAKLIERPLIRISVQ